MKYTIAKIIACAGLVGAALLPVAANADNTYNQNTPHNGTAADQRRIDQALQQHDRYVDHQQQIQQHDTSVDRRNIAEAQVRERKLSDAKYAQERESRYHEHIRQIQEHDRSVDRRRQAEALQIHDSHVDALQAQQQHGHDHDTNHDNH